MDLKRRTHEEGTRSYHDKGHWPDKATQSLQESRTPENSYHDIIIAEFKIQLKRRPRRLSIVRLDFKSLASNAANNNVKVCNRFTAVGPLSDDTEYAGTSVRVTILDVATDILTMGKPRKRLWFREVPRYPRCKEEGWTPKQSR